MCRLFAASWSFLCSLLKRKRSISGAVLHSFEAPRSFFWILEFVVNPVAAQNLFNDNKNLRKIRMYKVALLPKIEVCCSQILHKDLAFQRSDCMHYKFIWLYRNREICPSLMHKSLLPQSEGLCPSGRGQDAQREVYFQCSLHQALSEPVSATVLSRTPSFWAKNPSPLTVALGQQSAPFNRKKGKFGKRNFQKGGNQWSTNS